MLIKNRSSCTSNNDVHAAWKKQKLRRLTQSLHFLSYVLSNIFVFWARTAALLYNLHARRRGVLLSLSLKTISIESPPALSLRLPVSRELPYQDSCSETTSTEPAHSPLVTKSVMEARARAQVRILSAHLLVRQLSATELVCPLNSSIRKL